MTKSPNSGHHGTADEYARSQRCFLDHREAPFNFKDQMLHIKQTLCPIQLNGMVPQPGLIATPLPPSDINLDETEHALTPISSNFSEIEAPTAISFLGFIGLNQLYLPRESLDLGYDLEKEVQRYHNTIQSKRSCEFSLEWLPLSSVDIEKDEGLPLPSASSRWQRLAIRELDHEAIEIPEEAATIAKFARGDQHENDYPGLWNDCNLQGLGPYPELVSPPMSPISETGTFFVPSPGIAVIDLTSEPSSPIGSSVVQLQEDFANGRLDSEPVALSDASSSNPPDQLNFQHGSLESSAHLLDVPMVGTTSSDVEQDSNIFDVGFLKESCARDPMECSEKQDSFFDKALLEVLSDRQYRTLKMLEEERLTLLDSVLRLQLPNLSFDVPAPEWSKHLSSPEAQLSWLRRTFRNSYEIPSEPNLIQLGSTLKWTPVPQDSSRVSLDEDIGQLSEANKEYCILEKPQLCSRSFFVKESAPKILRIAGDEEIQVYLSPNEDEIDAGMKDISGPTGVVDTAIGLRNPRSLLNGLPGTLAPSLRRKAQDSSALLPDSSDSSATSKLLSAFIELRYSKKPRLLREGTSVERMQAPTKVLPGRPSQSQILEPPPPVEHECCELSVASAPEFSAPEAKCLFIVSLALSRSLLTRLEKSHWGFELMDRDFTQYNSVAWSPGSTQRQTCTSSLSYEADICLSPSTGVIVTNLLSVKQKPLPGATTASPLRDRVQRVSDKYEALFILVSEANVAGEYTGNPIASDIAAYADFANFTASLGAGVITYLVPGAEETLRKWILSLMEKSAGQAASFRHCLQPRDTTWEMLLRGAGMNVFAAQALGAVLLADYGNIGLAQFLGMTTEERVGKFGQMMGGDRVLRNVCQALDREWM